ncbi:beta-L-arabinofuranosidase domain-containing protein [Dactylosporangium sp. CS-033363]|uniref:beta-L-arabinofuranosidase domain-containing protein n=1 Tax=Dactylosporangium sp. CS-033363 TaxID=3239935 RepID=UPI003D9130BA
MTAIKRRTLLQASALGAATAALAPELAGSAPAFAADVVPPQPGPGGTAPVRPFELGEVRLGSGLFQEKRDRTKAFLRAYDERRFLVLFNNQAGRTNPAGVNVPGGWEDGGLLSGHWAGHYLTALAQAYADQGEAVYKTKLDWMVTELAACQAAITARMDTAPGGGGEQPPVQIGRVQGRFGNALKLNGTSKAQYCTLPQEAINQLTSFTIATWLNLASTGSWTRLFDFGSGTTVNMFLTPRAGVTGNVPRFAITVGGSGQEQQINGTAALPINQWVHIAVTLSGTTGTMYVNGQPVGTNANMTLNPSRLGNPGNRWIGRSQYGDPFLDATVDEFHIFDRALTQTELVSMLDSPAGSTGGGNIAWYRFDETDGTALKDASPNGRDAGIVAASTAGAADWIPTFPGYLGAIPEDAVLRLGPPRWAVYGGNAATNTWAPWYTQHKIMRGLLDAYYHTGNAQALTVVTKMADWAHLALTIGDKNHPDYPGPLTRDDLNYMWDLYIGGEFGGANEIFPEIYQLTGDAKHLDTAKAFDNRESLFGACVENRDILVVTPQNRPGRRRAERLHANTHVPQFIGYLRIFEHGGGQEYFTAAKNFYGMIVPHRMFAHGGTSGNYPGSNNNLELFQNRDDVAAAIPTSGAESCTTYNVMKLARNLFLHEHDPAYMDYYERGLVNMILGSRADTTATGDPQVTYFQPVAAGTVRGYGNTGTCCGGTGLENHTKYQETVFLKSDDGGTLWVNLYLPSTLTWAEKGFTITQATSYPREDHTRLTVDGSGALDLKLRVPAWCKRGFTVTVNGTAQSLNAQPGTYVTLSRTWTPGDVVEVRIPFVVHVERAIDRPETQALFWGPVLLQLLGAANRDLTLYKHLKLDGDYAPAAVTASTVTAAGDQTFTAGGFTLRPYYISDTQSTSTYFRRVEPTIVFGSVDSGVPNRKRNDGLPNYDVPVSGVTSPGTDGPTFLDLLWDQAPFASHSQFVAAVGTLASTLLSAAEKDTVIAAANAARQELSAGYSVEVTARTQRIGTSMYVSVNARNTDSVPLTIELITAYGSRTVAGVAPGASAYQSFNSRLASIPPGTVTVKATGQGITSEFTAPY